MREMLLDPQGFPRRPSRARPPRGVYLEVVHRALRHQVAFVALGIGLGACSAPQVANLCRLPDPDRRPPATSGDDAFVAPKRIPESEATKPPRGPAGPIGPEVWACVHATATVQGLFAMGGSFPCLAAIGDVRNGPDPEGPAVACPAWLNANEVALFSLEHTVAVRDQGTADACCYRYRRYLYQ
jgi:hypothetical protein